MALTYTTYDYNTGGTTAVTTLASASISYTAGQPIIATAGFGSAVTASITDTAGLTWTLVGSNTANAGGQYVWATVPGSSGSTTITTHASTTAYWSMRVITHSGAAGLLPVNVSNGNLGFIGSPTSFGPTITPTTNGSALWVAVNDFQGIATPFTANTGNTAEGIVQLGSHVSDGFIRPTTQPVTTNSAVTLTGTAATSTNISWVAFEIPAATGPKYTDYGFYTNTGGSGTASLASGTISYVNGQPIVVEAGAGPALTISDTSGLTWTQLATQSVIGNPQYVWYAIPSSSGTTVITLTQASGTAYFGFHVVAYTSGAGTPTGAILGSISGGGGISSVTAFSQNITPTSSNSVVWMTMLCGYGPAAPTVNAGTVISDNSVISGNVSYFTLSTAVSPLTSNSMVTLSGSTNASFQTVEWIAYEVPAIVVPSNIGLPSTDTSTGAWTSSLGSALYVPISEVTYNDTDFISTTSASTYTGTFSSTVFPGGSAPTLSYRASSPIGSTLTVTLKQGATTIMTRSHVLTSTLTTYTDTLTGPETALIVAGPITYQLASS